MSDPQATFFELSQLLTGFSAKKLQLTDLSGPYYTLANDHVPGSLATLLSQFETLAAGTTVANMTPEQRQSIGEDLLGGPHTSVTGTAQAIIALWYLGSWYQPLADGSATSSSGSPGGGFVASDQAYISGLSWQVMQSHAMGNSTYTFGYWAEDPPALDEFTGQPSPPASS